MKYLVLFMFMTYMSCVANQRLPSGNWEGSLTPMNHPEMNLPLNYKISYENDQLALKILGPDEIFIQAWNVEFDRQKLTFNFNEPEENVLLHCELNKERNWKLVGRCADDEGKWATFEMSISSDHN